MGQVLQNTVKATASEDPEAVPTLGKSSTEGSRKEFGEKCVESSAYYKKAWPPWSRNRKP